MKYIILLTSLALILNVYAQDSHNHPEVINKTKEAAEHNEHNNDEHEDDEHDDHDDKDNEHDSHIEVVDVHDEHTESEDEHDEHEGHGHVENKKSLDEHDDCDDKNDEHDSHIEGVEVHDEQTEEEHEEEKGIFVSPEMIKTVGIKMEKAHGGAIARYTTLPAEIKLNRNKHTGISPKYASTVRQIFVEIGDKVKKDDVLVSLENRSTLTVYTLLAPFDGTIISKNVAIGESVEEGIKLFELADLSSVWADVSVYPKYLHKIKKGSSVTVVATDNHTVNGTISYISPLASEETRTFIARVVLNNAGTDFIPGFFVRAIVQLDKKDVAIRVNRAAVQTISGEYIVFIKEHDNFITQIVQTGFYDNQYIEITSGLKVGDSYVAKGAFTLKAEITTSGLDPHAGHGH